MAPKRAKNSDDVIQQKLDVLITLLQDLFIVEATRSGIGPTEIRKVLGIAMGRVARISKHIE